MKTVYIVRHAKSSWADPELPDAKRPLLEKGKKRTQKIIDFLHAKDIRVDHIISSHAVRALHTARLLARALNYPEEDIRIDPQIYLSDGEDLFQRFYGLPEKFRSVMIVGHNPALTDFANHFLSPPIDNLPTSGVVSVTFNTDQWEDLPLAGFQVNFSIFPRTLG